MHALRIRQVKVPGPVCGKLLLERKVCSVSPRICVVAVEDGYTRLEGEPSSGGRSERDYIRPYGGWAIRADEAHSWDIAGKQRLLLHAIGRYGSHLGEHI